MQVECDTRWVTGAFVVFIVPLYAAIHVSVCILSREVFSQTAGESDKLIVLCCLIVIVIHAYAFCP